MKAMILAAGLGTRLRPLTETVPKALVPINGKPILEIIILQLKSYGFNDIIVNLHHHYDLMIDFLRANNNFGINIQVSDEKDEVLDTGGGIKKAAWFLDDDKPFLIHNVDVLSDINLKAMYDFHCDRHPLATLAVKDKDSSRSLVFDHTYRLYGWENSSTGESRIVSALEKSDRTNIGFCGIHVIDPDIFLHMDEKEKFSIITTYMNVSMDHPIIGYPVEQNLWIDIGSFEKLELAQSIDPQIYLKL
jgi:NDP-sugar pyrophosphorylase family protein